MVDLAIPRQANGGHRDATRFVFAYESNPALILSESDRGSGKSEIRWRTAEKIVIANVVTVSFDQCQSGEY